MKRGGPLERRAPMPRSRAGSSRTTSSRRLRRPAMDGELRHAVWVRAGGHCDLCGVGLPSDRWEAHHRQLRSRGGPDSHANLACLCPFCHGWVHANPARATALGFMLPATSDPEAAPFMLRGWHWVQPHPGGYRPAPAPERTP